MIFTFTRSIGTVNRIADFVSKTLGVPWCSDEEVAESPLDKLIVVAGGAPFAGKTILDAIGHVVSCTPKVVWITNDYNVSLPTAKSKGKSPYRACFRERLETGLPPVQFWSTVEAQADVYMNWNCLLPSQEIFLPWHERQFRDRMIYYGYYRPEREAYFERYFRHPAVPTDVSYPFSGKSEAYFDSLMSIRAKQKTHPDDLIRMLSHYGLGLYLEDNSSHHEFHSPANRFYEMYAAGIPIVFQPEARATMEKGGYRVDQFVAHSDHMLKLMLNEAPEMRRRQEEVFGPRIAQERAELPDLVRRSWEAL